MKIVEVPQSDNKEHTSQSRVLTTIRGSNKAPMNFNELDEEV